MTTSSFELPCASTPSCTTNAPGVSDACDTPLEYCRKMVGIRGNFASDFIASKTLLGFLYAKLRHDEQKLFKATVSTIIGEIAAERRECLRVIQIIQETFLAIDVGKSMPNNTENKPFFEFVWSVFVAEVVSNMIGFTDDEIKPFVGHFQRHVPKIPCWTSEINLSGNPERTFVSRLAWIHSRMDKVDQEITKKELATLSATVFAKYPIEGCFVTSFAMACTQPVINNLHMEPDMASDQLREHFVACFAYGLVLARHLNEVLNIADSAKGTFLNMNHLCELYDGLAITKVWVDRK